MKNTLSWSDVSLSLLQKGTSGQYAKRSILSKIDGHVTDGQFLAIMGPSGCGKSSLLNALCGRVRYSKKAFLEGTVLYNDRKISDFEFNKLLACVSQDDMLFSYLTVRETLYLAAFFTSKQDNDDVERIHNKVNIVMKELNLSVVAETIIGSATRRGVSGGEYKRVLIGKELMKRPKVVFLDEPTSGLDSYQALSVMESMKLLAVNNIIVVAVIHQPRSSIFQLFDQLMLLSDGRIIYFGAASRCIQHFNSMQYYCPALFNPADYFLDLLSINVKSSSLEIDSKLRIHQLILAWESKGQVDDDIDYSLDEDNAPLGVNEEKEKQEEEEEKEYQPDDARFLEHININQSEEDIEEGRGSDYHHSMTFHRWLNEFLLLNWRSSIEVYRNYSAMIIKTATILFFAAFLSLLYYGLDNSQKGIQDRVGLLYFLLINQSFTPLFGILNQFPSEKVLVSREVLGGSYLASSYYLSRVMAELPFAFFSTVVYCTIIYWSVGLNPIFTRFIVFTATIVLNTFCALAIGFCVSAASPSSVIALAIGPPVLIIFLLFGGFYINVSSLPIGSKWVRFVSLIYWSFQALVVNEFEGETFECDPGAPTSCTTTGEQELANLSFEEGSVTISLVALSALTVGFTVLGYIALLLNRERYCVLQATQRTTVSKSQFPRHVMQYDGPDNNTYSIKLVEPQSFDDDLVAESGQQARRDEEERTSVDELYTIQV